MIKLKTDRSTDSNGEILVYYASMFFLIYFNLINVVPLSKHFSKHSRDWQYSLDEFCTFNWILISDFNGTSQYLLTLSLCPLLGGKSRNLDAHT